MELSDEKIGVHIRVSKPIPWSSALPKKGNAKLKMPSFTRNLILAQSFDSAQVRCMVDEVDLPKTVGRASECAAEERALCLGL
jgi:hypothetical protein